LNVDEFLTPDAIVIYPSRGRVFLALLGSAVFVALGAFLWRIGGIRNQVAAVASCVVFGLCLIFAVIRLISHQPALIINSSCLMDNSSALGGYTVRWDEVEGIYISSVRASLFSTQRFLSICLKRPEEFLSRQSAFRARWMKANVALVGAPVNISASPLPVRLEELMAMIQKNLASAQASSTR
jgi:hypothetical protein